jgi:hypothetical protein
LCLRAYPPKTLPTHWPCDHVTLYSNHATASDRLFASDVETRNQRCVAKDMIVRDVIRKLDVSPTFTAILMPAAYGPEVEILESRGVRRSNMFAIEREPAVRRIQEAQGLRVPPKAMTSDHAVDCVPFEHVDFCYLDFLGRPSTSHLETIRKLVRLNLLVEGSCFLVTLGVNRGDGFSCPMSVDGQVIPGTAYLRAAVKWARGLQPKSATNHEYTSVTDKHAARYLTTEMWF